MFKSLFVRLVFLFLCIVAVDAAAQTQRKIYKGQYHRGKATPDISLKNISKNELLTIYGTLGLASYNGDLSGYLWQVGSNSYRPQAGGGVILRTAYLGKRLNLRADVRCFRLYSNDVHEGRNLNFRSTNWEFLALGQFDIFPYEKLMRRRTKINPYVYGGIGLMTYDPWGQLPNGRWHQLRPLETENVKYGNVAFVYTVGLGFKYNYSYRWNFMLEAGYRFTTTDYIDDVSSEEYPDPASLQNSISRIMSNKSFNKSAQTGRGNPKYKDGYAIVSVGLTYTFTRHHATKNRKGGLLDKNLLRKN
ncbi:hypothetical protein [Cytophaga hutchinsonii]|uniref:DUF6089 domain-containing protein n=1 Tax=Cytophaga hutchinsonii (strain ATCC 33406 / DSM 1761 / CIP 103989 / NBRC 15051 / NCIMB 9469 / D465) TaxID=269798 RepID=A0A6N4SPM3_CYTH3|nr:hypothetical protein [Cytophaga hutchinsonii]ABG58198.1 hypothetical protein CHU_0917 [Cytophaga hutchinsonii ATCC 33406]SFX55402.1 hypothetical protein SAMN04487930_105238 [Cytophaga hutchinsonii ATCC 33406]